jgi:hypothetical protein
MDARELAARRIAESVVNYINLVLQNHSDAVEKTVSKQIENTTIVDNLSEFTADVGRVFSECTVQKRDFILRLIDEQGGLGNIATQHRKEFLQKIKAIKETER